MNVFRRLTPHLFHPPLSSLTSLKHLFKCYSMMGMCVTQVRPKNKSPTKRAGSMGVTASLPYLHPGQFRT